MLSLSNRRRSEVGPRRTTIRDRHGNDVVLRRDEITDRNAKLADGLGSIHLDRITDKVSLGMFDGMTTSDLDQLSIDACLDLGIKEDPQYFELASGVAWSNHVKSTPATFGKAVAVMQ